ncbi:hypothetical protein Pint_12260 [Pistacia integerrima]|uniref:Uncharacterized protein n=1 Tax=Pistacia integerrima TaxID=434235 RepID=A0ACC0XF38_9ROSI|nr:hypothetical protein Pint_12260 [Pistacia integerrima]
MTMNNLTSSRSGKVLSIQTCFPEIKSIVNSAQSSRGDDTNVALCSDVGKTRRHGFDQIASNAVAQITPKAIGYYVSSPQGAVSQSWAAPGEAERNRFTDYVSLHLAALKGEWEYAKAFFMLNPQAVSARITRNQETTLHIANKVGNTALCFAAASRIKRIAEDTDLKDEDRIELLIAVINIGLYGLALNLIQHHPQLAIARDGNGETALHVLARKPLEFVSGELAWNLAEVHLLIKTPPSDDSLSCQCQKLENYLGNLLVCCLLLWKWGMLAFTMPGGNNHISSMLLIIGLAALFISIATMMAAFGATLFIVLGDDFSSVAIPIASVACVPVTLFALLLPPFFLFRYSHLYKSSIFSHPSHHFFY